MRCWTLLALLVVACGRAAPRTAIVDVTVINPADGTRREHVNVVFSGDHIDEIKPAGSVRPEAAHVLDGRGKFLLPGFRDMDTAVFHPSSLGRLLANGVTGIRNTHGRLLALTAWRREIRAGKRAGPRMIIAGPTLDGISSTRRRDQSIQVDADDAVSIVASIGRSGADFIVVSETLSRAAFFAIASEAKRTRIPFAGHVPQEVTAAEASDAGMASMEQLAGVSDASAFATLIENRTWQVPTLTSNRQSAVALTAAMHRAGVPMLAGTASDGGAGHTVHDELALLVRAGLAPVEALRCATSGPADYDRRSDMGRIAVGNIADMVLLSADPTADIRNSATVVTTIAAGRVYERPALDAMLQAATMPAHEHVLSR